MNGFISFPGLGTAIIVILISGILNVLFWVISFRQFGWQSLFPACMLIVFWIAIYRIWNSLHRPMSEIFPGMLFSFVVLIPLIWWHYESKLLPLRLITAVIVVIILGWILFELKGKNNVHFFLKMNAGTGYTVNLRDWVISSQYADWNAVFRKHTEKRIIAEAIKLYFYSLRLNDEVTQNTFFRDAAFKAWSEWNNRHPEEMIGFHFTGGLRLISAPDSYLPVIHNVDFMKWWIEYGLRDKKQMFNLISFLEKLDSLIQYFEAEQQASVHVIISNLSKKYDQSEKLKKVFNDLLLE